jgi:hypothetical protein
MEYCFNFLAFYNSEKGKRTDFQSYPVARDLNLNVILVVGVWSFLM